MSSNGGTALVTGASSGIGAATARSLADAGSGDGRHYPVRWEIVELTEPELLVLESPPQPEFGFVERMTTRVVFEADGDRTRVTITQGPHTDETIQDADAGWTSVLDNLEALVRTASP